MRAYHAAAIVCALLAALIFSGWAVIYGSSPLMRLACVALIAVTGWVVIRATLVDRQRARHRQVRIEAEPREAPRLCVTDPSSTTRFPLTDIQRAAWRHDNLQDAGLWMFDKQGAALAHLDLDFLTDEAEARTFVGWVRRHTGAAFPVQWPSNG